MLTTLHECCYSPCNVQSHPSYCSTAARRMNHLTITEIPVDDLECFLWTWLLSNEPTTFKSLCDCRAKNYILIQKKIQGLIT